MRTLLVTGLAVGWVSSLVALSAAANLAALFQQTSPTAGEGPGRH